MNNKIIVTSGWTGCIFHFLFLSTLRWAILQQTKIDPLFACLLFCSLFSQPYPRPRATLSFTNQFSFWVVTLLFQRHIWYLQLIVLSIVSYHFPCLLKWFMIIISMMRKKDTSSRLVRSSIWLQDKKRDCLKIVRKLCSVSRTQFIWEFWQQISHTSLAWRHVNTRNHWIL